ncbi:helix-turn-helix domain-containing protein [Halorubrum sp. AD140]|uniref:helix-turn-helix domain-containing protein n=1 Tax=Halorubrum sp. AD140 TaxID=3050073 RepID=UPI002ACC816B|nr:helix-turn-helix domain-containing protein [Halorubrum sp. AD140]MDZ5810858.1 helix-turn-helix domain-containing protein [Halorubrum sp. AD140]
MSRTRLRLDLPAGSWLGDASRARPGATLRVKGAVAADGGDVVALSVGGVGRAEAIEAIRDHEAVQRVDVVERRGGGTVTRVVGRPPAHVAAARRVGLVIPSTVDVADGAATLTLVDDRARLSAFARRLAAEGVAVAVEAAGDDPEPTLTDAQRELLLAAVEAGYYDTPRGCTLTDLAADRDIAKSTCSETLHRAEGRVLRRFVDGDLRFDAADASERADRRRAASDAGEAFEASVTEP